MKFIRSIYNPAIYHGQNKKAPFFEGWYYKIISRDQQHKFAIIPGIYIGKNKYSFIQILDGNNGNSHFIKFPFESFISNNKDFHVQIENNSFELDKISLDMNHNSLKIEGNLSFENVKGWPIKLLSPGIMGWYSFIPKMECNHGILGFNHNIYGSLNIEQKEIDFTHGRGYIEKDWGKSFPEGYIWMQSNHFSTPNVSFSGSIAIIPWLKKSFLGFIVGLYIDETLYKFTTYSNAKIKNLYIDSSRVVWEIEDKNFYLKIISEKGISGELKGPTLKDMEMRVAESLNAKIKITLKRKKDNTIVFDDIGFHGGLEIAGDIDKLLSFKTLS